VNTFDDELASEAVERAFAHDRRRIAILGLNPAGAVVKHRLDLAGLSSSVLGVFDPSIPEGSDLARPWAELAEGAPDLLVVTGDADKEALLLAYWTLCGEGPNPPEVVLAGIAHLDFADPLFDELDAPALVPSYATGYAFTRVHIYQCLVAAAAAGIEGAVVEFGAFKGGTTAWLARVVRRLGLNSQVIAFDSWAGFPERRSVLDLYTHPRCVFTDVVAVRSHLEPLGVELVVGDITETASPRLSGEPILLAFVDTDNYSPAKAALQAVVPNLVHGGAIVFDHYETTAEYVYTVGERIAAREVLSGTAFAQIHGTGVFIKVG
jgi:hypothetical protein